ncbi:hypothetical protein AURDEDRAFT_164029 [Auricularia subglabra TFB-10046 SS5]|nr:hypothetical protein AURDEDRAFT_164029 [Auricularia subglabra TFB-10046 SS5]
MSCRVFVVRTDTGVWSLWLETQHKGALGLGISPEGQRECPNPVLDTRACVSALVVGWLPARPFAAHRAWAEKFFDTDADDEPQEDAGDSLDFVLRVLDDGYIAAYLDVLPTRCDMEELFDPEYDVVEDGPQSDEEDVIIISPTRLSHAQVEVV